MTQTELKNILQLLHSNDPQNAILGINLLWSFKEIPKTLDLALGLMVHLGKNGDVTKEAFSFLEKRMGAEGFKRLTVSLLVFIQAQNEHHMIFRQPEFALYSNWDMMEAFEKHHQVYAPIVALHPYYLNLYLKTGNTQVYISTRPNRKDGIFFEDALQYHENHPYALFGLAYHYGFNLQEPTKALEYYEQFVVKHPNLKLQKQMMIDYSLEDVYLDLPTTFNAHQHKARIFHHQLQDYRQAIRCYHRAKLLIGDHPLLDWRDFAELIWFYEDNIDAAWNLAEEGLSILSHQRFPPTYLFGIHPSGFVLKKAELNELAGDIWLEKEDASKALKFYKNALQNLSKLEAPPSLNPYKIAVLLKQIRVVFEHFKDYWQVESLCKKVLKLDSENFEAQKYMKQIRQRRGLK